MLLEDNFGLLLHKHVLLLDASTFHEVVGSRMLLRRDSLLWVIALHLWLLSVPMRFPSEASLIRGVRHHYPLPSSGSMDL